MGKKVNELIKANLILKQEKILKLLSIILSASYILSFIIIAILRMNYPYELEWMEGGQVEHIVRILGGQQIYVAPSLDFIPYIYTPLYSYLGALVSLITGVGFFPLRLISILSTVGIFIYLYLIVKNETDSKYWGLIAAGMFAASFKICGFWFDIARVDSLFIFLFIASIYYLRIKEKPLNFIISGVLAGLSFLTKQSVIFMLFPVLLYFLIRKEKKGFYYFIALLVIAVSVSLYFNIVSHGWYWFWNFGLPAGHHWNFKYLYAFWINDLIEPLAISFVLLIIYFILNKSVNSRKPALFYFLLLAGCLLDSWLLRLHYGGYLNVIMPAVILIILISVLGFKKLQDEFSTNQTNSIKVLVYLLVIFQFVLLNYNPMHALPTKADRVAGDNFIEKLKENNGDVFVPCHSYIPRYAGKKSYAHAVVIHDLLISHSSLKFQLQSELETAFRNKKFSAVILNPDWEFEFLDKYYYKAGSIFKDTLNFFTVIGKTRPNDIYLPR